MTQVKVNNEILAKFKYDSLDRRTERDYLIPHAKRHGPEVNIPEIENKIPPMGDGFPVKRKEFFFGTIQRASYTWDEANQLLGINNQITEDRKQVTENKNQSNLSSVLSLLSSFIYTYDNVGNRQQMTALDGIQDYAYNTIYELTEEKLDTIPVHSYDYDNVGNREVADGGIYQANSLNQERAMERERERDQEKRDSVVFDAIR